MQILKKRFKNKGFILISTLILIIFIMGNFLLGYRIIYRKGERLNSNINRYIDLDWKDRFHSLSNHLGCLLNLQPGRSLPRTVWRSTYQHGKEARTCFVIVCITSLKSKLDDGFMSSATIPRTASLQLSPSTRAMSSFAFSDILMEWKIQ